MTKYFFNIFIGGNRVLDEEGLELTSLDIAEAEATKDTQCLMSDAVLQGRDISYKSATRRATPYIQSSSGM